MGCAATTPTGSALPLHRGSTRSRARESALRRLAAIRGDFHRSRRGSPGAPARLGYLLFQPRHLRLKIVQPEQERIETARLHIATALPAVHQQSKVAGGAVLPAP